MAADKSLKDLTNSVVKIAENQPKIQKDVKDIRDAICNPSGILEAIQSISEKLDRQQKKEQLKRLTGRGQRASEINGKNIVKNTNSTNKLLSKILGKMDGLGGGRSTKRTRLNPDMMRRGGDKRLKGLEGISRSVEIVERLKGLKVKDFLFAKKKLKNIGKIMSKSLTLFRKFKNQKEVDGTLSFVEASIDLVKKLGKVALLSKPAQWGEKAIEKIFMGKRGEGGLLKLFRKIHRHKRDIDVSHKSINKIAKTCGSMLLTSIVLAGIAVTGIPAMLGALLMKGIVWLLIGTFKMLRRASKSVIKGSAVLLIMSASIISFGLGLVVMGKAVKDMKLKDVGIMIASLAGMSLTVAGIGLLAAPIAIGSATLLLLGVSLGIFGLALNAWKNMDAKKPIGNIKIAVEGLREVFGIELGKNNEKKNIFQRLGEGVMGIAMGLLNFGQMFFVMGSLLLAGAALGILYKGLKNWENFNATKSVKNIKTAIGALKETFGLDDKNGKKEGLKDKLKKFGGKILDMGISLLQGGKELAKMATITIATGMADVIRLTLIPWRNFDARPAAKNIGLAFNALKEAFGLEDKANENLGQKTLRFLGGPLELASTLMSAGGVLVKMGTIMLATGLADVIKFNLKPWKDNTGVDTSITNLGNAIGSLKSIFGLEDEEPEGIGVISFVGDIFSLASTLLKCGGVFAKMGTITLATGLAGKIKENIMPWETYEPKNAITNIGKAVNGLLELFGIDPFENKKEEKSFWENVGGFFKNIGSAIKSGSEFLASAVQGGTALAKMGTIGLITNILSGMKDNISSFENFNVNFKSTIDNINAIDVSKAATVIDVFKSFSNIKEKPIDAFTQAVNKFSDSCTELIDSLNGFNSSNITVSDNNTTSGETIANGNVSIKNKEELAEAFATAIKSIPVNIRTDISDVKLVVNGEAGKRVVITLDN